MAFFASLRGEIRFNRILQKIFRARNFAIHDEIIEYKFYGARNYLSNTFFQICSALLFLSLIGDSVANYFDLI